MPGKHCGCMDDLKDCRDTGKPVPAAFQREWAGRHPTRAIKILAGVETTKAEVKSRDAAATPPTGVVG